MPHSLCGKIFCRTWVNQKQNDTRKWVIGTNELLLRPRKKVSLKYFGHYQFLKLFEWLKHCKTQIFNLGRWCLGFFFALSADLEDTWLYPSYFHPFFQVQGIKTVIFFKLSVFSLRDAKISYCLFNFLNWIFNYQCFPRPIGRYVRYIKVCSSVRWRHHQVISVRCLKVVCICCVRLNIILFV